MLKEKILFEPILITFSSESEEFKINNCVSRGKYCAFDIGGNGDINGKMIVYESLRQKCIYKSST